MVSTGPMEPDLIVMALPRPPEDPGKSHHKKGFQYRGTLFRPSSASSVRSAPNVKSVVDTPGLSRPQCKPCIMQQHSNDIVPEDSSKNNKPRRIQSAKGRLERHLNRPSSACSSRSHALSLFKVDESYEKTPNIVDLNSVVDVPDKEEEMLMRKAHLLRCDAEQFHNKMRPSSAKSFISNTPAVVSDYDAVDENPDIKSSVVGLKYGRHVFGNTSDTQEAWAKTEKDFPFKLSSEQKGTSLLVSTNEDREIPASLEPLRPYLSTGTPASVLGVDPSSCLVFLPHDYSCEELPEVPTPQRFDDPLPYTCVVATPRKEVTPKFSHPYYERQSSSPDWVCNHSSSFNPETHSDISNLLNPPIRCNPNQVRQEIAELENILLGIGSLESSCSFVKFQAEIERTQVLARKLISQQAGRFDEPEPVDTFGLLKFCKDHDEVMKVIKERRNCCIEELAQLDAVM